MKKKRTDKNIMKKNNFVQGAFVATLGIVITKILGILYVIPFYSIIGEKGGALYGYAYSIYLVFMAISSAGIPLAISKLISEYQTLGYYDAKQRAFKIGKQISITLGIICFIILFIFAKPLAVAILGDLKGGNTIEDVTFVIRVISTAILVVPVLSVYRGYFEGHKFITPTAISQVVEQVARIIVIIFGSYAALNVFHLSLTTAVGVATFGATAGALVGYLYLLDKVFKHKKEINEITEAKEEPVISTKEILGKIFFYALPFIMIDVFKSAYNFVDMTTLVKTLVHTAGYTTVAAENSMSVISTWGNKLNMIIVSISTGIIISLIPNLTSSSVKGDKKDVHHKINQTLQILLFLSVPMTIGLSFLSKPVWDVFYGSKSAVGAQIMAYYIFVALIISTYTALVSIVQVLKYYKEVFISLFAGVLIKALTNVYLIKTFYSLGFQPVYGSITATILGYLAGIILCLHYLKKKCGVSYKPTIKITGKIILADIFMILALFLVKLVIPISSSVRLLNIPIILVYTIIGAGIYLLISYKSGVIEEVLGKEMLTKIKRKVAKK